MNPIDFCILFSFNMFLTSANETEKFCDERHEHNLFDGMFNFDRTVFAFRSDSLNVWRLKKSNNHMYWTQIGNPIDVSQLFLDIALPSFQSGFAITNYVACDPSLESSSERETCDSTKQFDPNDIVFLFSGIYYQIYRKFGEFLFSPVNTSDRNIPWNNRLSTLLRISEKELFGIKTPIDCAVYNQFENNIILLSKSIVYKINVSVDYQNKSSINILDYSPIEEGITGNGGIIIDKQIVFFANNNVWSVESDIATITNLNQTYWQFFECDTMVVSMTEDSNADQSITTGSSNTYNQIRLEFTKYRRKIRTIFICFFICTVFLCVAITGMLFISYYGITATDSRERYNQSDEDFNSQTYDEMVNNNR